jgi:pimeloyl-ACP methyl ester carboxylesterase
MFDGAPDPDRVCEWLDDLVDCTCATPPVVVGHTLGGAIAARFASAREGRLARLVLVDTVGLVAFRPAPEFGAALQAFLAAPNGDTQEGLWKQCLFDLPAVKRRLGADWEAIEAYTLATARRPGGIAALGAWMAEFGASAIPPAVLSRIAVPTTLVWGRHDRATPLAAAEDACARYRWGLQVIEDAADDPTLDQPETFISTLRHILAS